MSDVVGFTVSIAHLSVEDVYAALEDVYIRVDTLRTFFSTQLEKPQQYIHEPDLLKMPVTVVPAASVSDTLAELYGTAFDTTVPHPYRFILSINKSGLVDSVSLVISHMLVDLAGVDLLKKEICACLEGGIGTPISGIRKLRDLEDDEDYSSADRFFEEGYGAFPNTIFPGVPDHPDTDGKYYYEIYTSQPLGRLIARKASQLGVLSSAYVLASYAAALSSMTGAETVGIINMMHNRMGARRNVAANLVSGIPIAVHVAHASSIGVLATEVSGPILRGFRSGVLAESHIARILNSVAQTRRVNLRLESVFNFVDIAHDAVGDVIRRDRHERVGAVPDPLVRMVCRVTGGSTQLAIEASSRAFDAHATRRLMDRVIDALLTGEMPVARTELGNLWVSRPSSLVRVAELESCYSSIPGVRDVSLSVQGGVIGARVKGSLSESDFLASLVERCSIDPRVVCADELSYQSAESVITGPSPSSPASLEALLAAVAEARGEADATETFFAQGGEYLQLGRVSLAMRNHGYLCWPSDFLHGRSLQAVSRYLDLGDLEPVLT
ncbi:hypothetical protein ABS642_07520 [Microbacterium sp. A8/3-1]|uniref:Condensation domain-containing protein n=1 Tax=Microbacterium sp. A8/3-1 TaxID=3160749 RepID=A0AAU7VZT1_9MICO